MNVRRAFALVLAFFVTIPAMPQFAREPVSECGVMKPGTNVFLLFHDQNFNCTQSGGSCSVASPIFFEAAAFADYNFNCANHTFSWDFGDGTGSTAQTSIHTYAASGSYSVTLVINSPTRAATLTALINVSVVPPPQPSSPCPPIIPGFNVFFTYSGSQSGCTPLGATCTTGEAIVFNAEGFGYSFDCAAHSFSWDFGDGQPANAGRDVTHLFANAGAYNVKLTIAVNGQVYVVSQPVTVQSIRSRRRAAHH